MQEYNSEQAFRRWRGRLGTHLQEARRLFAERRGLRWRDPAITTDEHLNFAVRWLVLNRGRLVWGVFARAFWPAYMPGKNNHYGTVVLSFDPLFEDSPGLFEIAEDLRRLRESKGEPVPLKSFAELIRDDYRSHNRVKIPSELSGHRKSFFQSIYIPRNRLPGGYLHHRLVPILTHPVLAYATILPLEFWPAEFTSTWLEGDRLLTKNQLAAYQVAFPNVTP